MPGRNRLFDDLAKVAGSAAGGLSELKAEVEARARQRIDDLAGRLDLVSREEFETVMAVAVKAREEQEALTARVAALEAEIAVLKAK